MNADRARGAGAVRSPSTATFLSFLWPGLGQWYLGRNRLALVYGLPVVAVALAALWQLNGGLADLAIQLFAPSFSLTVLVLIVLLGVWRLISMADAFTAAPLRTKSSRRPTTLFAVLTRESLARIIVEQPLLGAKILMELVLMLSQRLRATSERLLGLLDEKAEAGSMPHHLL